MGAGTDPTTSSLTNDEIDDLYLRAAELYPDNPEVHDPFVRALAIRQIRADAAKLTSYTANASSEDLSDVFKHLTELEEDWREELTGALMLAGLSERSVTLVPVTYANDRYGWSTSNGDEFS